MEIVLRVTFIYLFLMAVLRVMGKREFGELARKVGDFVAGSATVLAAEGHLVPANMDRERVAPAEIFESLHATGLEAMSQVKWVILETNGRLAVVPWHQPATVPQEQDRPV